MRTVTLLSVLVSIELGLLMAGYGQSVIVISPERFGVINVIPNNLSGETNQNSEPSLATGTGTAYGEFITHTFDMGTSSTGFSDNTYYTSVNGGTTWANVGQVINADFTLDWSPGGDVYAAFVVTPTTLHVARSIGIPGAFSPVLDTYSAMDNFPPDQPWVRVVRAKVNNSTNDCIYVAFNDLGHYGGIVASYGTGKTASILISTNSGATWQDVVIEHGYTRRNADQPPIRLALSPDGKMNYALFERFKDFTDVYGHGWIADVVLTRDDNFAGTFTTLPVNGNGGNDGLNDTQLAKGILLPCPSTSLGQQRLFSDCDVVINPLNPLEVYVAYDTVANEFTWPYVPVIVVQHSTDGGLTFNPVYTASYATGVPSLSVTKDGTVGLLFAAKQGPNLQVQFLKAPQGNFASPVTRTLASWPDNNPVHIGEPYIGDYFQLRSVGYNFYGIFSASNDPKPANFPSGVYYQRNVRSRNATYSDFFLNTSGSLVDLSNNAVNVSIDPFFFYDIAAITIPNQPYNPNLNFTYAYHYDPIDPDNGTNHFNWPELPVSFPQFQLQSSPAPGGSATWTTQTNGVTQANGQFEMAVDATKPMQFYRLIQDVASGQFRTFTSVDDNGTLTPGGVLTNAGLTSQTFTAVPTNNYTVGNWYLDGVVVQSGGPALTISNISTEHTLLVTFVPENDIAVSVSALAADEGPALVGGTYNYGVDVGNTGSGTVTGVTVTNVLDPTVTFTSAMCSQGSVTNFGNMVTASLGTLSNGASATILISVVPNSETIITDTVNVACSQFEPNLANNTAVDVSSVLTPVTIVTGPTNQTVSAGDTATFTVTASGTPPLFYQWVFNGTIIPGATNATLTITNVSGTDAGAYEVGVFQEPPGPEDVVQVESDPATLAVIGSFTQLQVLLPGESNAPNTMTGKTGTPTQVGLSGGGEITVTVLAVDGQWNSITNVSDTVQITCSDTESILPGPGALVDGSGQFMLFFGQTGSFTVTATDMTNLGIAPGTSSSVTVVP